MALEQELVPIATDNPLEEASFVCHLFNFAKLKSLD